MNDHERHLVRLLRNALEGDLEAGMKKFEEYYWPERDAVPWDSELAKAIHGLGSELEYFEPNENWRTSPGLYNHDELRKRILQVLALVPSD